MIEEKIAELIEKNVLMIDVEGTAVGQVNGLAVLDIGDYAFGKPSRITTRTYMGKNGVVDIERQVKMGGNIHSKGVLILSGYLGEKFAQDSTLSLNASICFEQSYEGVDGDSASSTEAYSLLSSLSEVPITQDIAVTGSMNQHGKIQPIGGVNEKIEGFFRVCRSRGLTGTQGVLIPLTNLKNLQLRQEVIDAVADGKFHIYPVKNIDQGIELLTGIEAGSIMPDGGYPEDTVYGKVDRRLRHMAETLRAFGFRT